MYTFRHLRQSATIWLGFLVVGGVGGWPAPARAQLPNDPVNELSQALKSPSGAPARTALLTKRIQALTTIGDLHRALTLDDWLDKDEDPLLEEARVDRQLRGVVAKRYEAMLRASLEHGDALRQVAAANLLSDLGTSIRSLNARDRGGLNRRFGPDLAALAKSGQPQVAEAAARALGNVNPEAKVAVPALTGLLRSNNAELRRAAAASLGSLIQRLTQIVSGKGKGATGGRGLQPELIRTAALVVPAAAESLNDADPKVRRLSVAALQDAAVALAELIPEPLKELKLDIGRQQLDQERADVESLAKILGEQAPKLVRALTDPDPAIRLATRKALEEFGNAVRRQERYVNSLSELPADKEPTEKRPSQNGDGANGSGQREGNQPAATAPVLKPLVGTLDETLRPLLRGLNDPDPAVRLATVDVLEMFGDAAKPAVPALIRAMSDRDLFVRWAAGRTLGKLAPFAAAEVVPALAKLLRDPDLDLRLAAAAALERFGPDAKAAIPALGRSVTEGDAEIRRAAMLALAAIGPEAKTAVPSLAAALANDNPRVRRTAAEVLSRLGQSARAAEGALRQAMNDSDPDVRKAASDAMLSILPKPAQEK